MGRANPSVDRRRRWLAGLGAVLKPSSPCEKVFPTLEKWPTQTNPADLLTKGLSRDRIQSLLQLMRMQAQGGRAPIAPVRDGMSPMYGPALIDYEADSDIGE